jgi:hypothetical protein
MKLKLDVWYELWDRAGSHRLDTWFELGDKVEGGVPGPDQALSKDGLDSALGWIGSGNKDIQDTKQGF